MKREQAMKNLWTVSAATPAAPFIHRLALPSGDFAPISNEGQRIDPLRQSGVIPLRGLSY